MTTTPERRIRVDLGPSRGYDVRIGTGLLDRLGPIALECGAARRGAGGKGGAGGRAFLIADDALPAPAISRAEQSLKSAGITPVPSRAHASETQKTLQTAERLLAEMSRHAFERAEPVIALGGGIIGDIAGFVAATYRRGVPVLQCPTTLLAMVDASVGGKTGVNLALGPHDLKKNMVGAFHQPRAVIADVSVLASLPDRVFRAGLAECIKHGMIAADFGDSSLADWTRAHLDQILRKDAPTLVELVARNTAVKAAVVGKDEREELGMPGAEGAPGGSGGRALLNLGHTFAHAIETLPGLTPPGQAPPLHHGEAVALGLLAAAHCSLAAGRCTPDIAATLADTLRQAGLPTTIRCLPPSPEILALMAHDKKVAAGKLRLILPIAPGRAAVFEDPPRQAVIAGIDALRA